jgi:hypothetical protein
MLSNEEFFNYIVGDQDIKWSCTYNNELIHFKGTYFRYHDLVKDLSHRGYNVYYAPNIINWKDSYFKLNASFIDLYYGIGNNIPINITGKYKASKIDELEHSDIPPTCIVMTRNGLQAYWALEAGATVGQFNVLEKILVNRFQANKAVTNPTSPLRVPSTFCCKDSNNHYLCDIITFNDVRYNIGDMIN